MLNSNREVFRFGQCTSRTCITGENDKKGNFEVKLKNGPHNSKYLKKCSWRTWLYTHRGNSPVPKILLSPASFWQSVYKLRQPEHPPIPTNPLDQCCKMNERVVTIITDFSKNYGTLIYLIILIENFICKPKLLVFFFQ